MALDCALRLAISHSGGSRCEKFKCLACLRQTLSYRKTMDWSAAIQHEKSCTQVGMDTVGSFTLFWTVHTCNEHCLLVASLSSNIRRPEEESDEGSKTRSIFISELSSNTHTIRRHACSCPSIPIHSRPSHHAKAPKAPQKKNSPKPSPAQPNSPATC